MCRLIINGGNRINGEITVQGSKNAVLPMLAATILTNDQCVLHNCPYLSDTRTGFEILKALGCEVNYENGSACVCARKINGAEVPKDLMQRMRSSVSFMGVLLAKCGEVVLYRPGGCKLGERPVDMHISSLEKLGAEFYQCGECICGKLGKVKSGDITLIYPSVGVTENIMLMCAAKECEVKIFNPAREPEIVDLQNFLNMMGADIRGAGSDLIRICPAEKLNGCEYTVMQDRIAVATYACVTAACGGRLHMKDAVYEHMRIIAEIMNNAGCTAQRTDDGVLIESDRRLSGVHKIKTLPYPAFPTDVQPILAAAFASSDGNLQISETVFENRFGYVGELVKMGASVYLENCNMKLTGVEKLHGAIVKAKDLRGGAALVTAALTAEGTSEINGVHYIDRGYEKIEDTLCNIGADVRRI